ncbi:MAG: hypothetical protein ABJH75_21925, partial [Roseibium sp.]
ERFTALKTARDVLLDKDRRAHYDATGEVRPEEKDQINGEALQTLTGMMAMIVAAEEDPASADILGKVDKMLREARREPEKRRSELEGRVKRIKAAQGRFSVEEGRENIFEASLASGLRDIEGAIGKIDKALAVFDKAADILKGFTYRRDEPAYKTIAAQPYAQMRNFTNTYASTW